jgi:hypothetical protein
MGKDYRELGVMLHGIYFTTKTISHCFASFLRCGGGSHEYTVPGKEGHDGCG